MYAAASAIMSLDIILPPATGAPAPNSEPPPLFFAAVGVVAHGKAAALEYPDAFGGGVHAGEAAALAYPDDAFGGGVAGSMAALCPGDGCGVVVAGGGGIDSCPL